MRIWIVDAFTNRAYKGNPAAVALVDQFPENDVCQMIAAEMHLSETAFVKKLERNHFHIRWFNPKVEVKLCGHATLASAHILYQTGMIRGNEIEFELLLERNLGSLGPSKPSYLLNSGKVLAALDSQENPSPFQERVLQTLSGPLKVKCYPPQYILDFPLQRTAGEIDVTRYFPAAIQAVKAVDDVIIELASEEEVIAYVPVFPEIEKIDARAVILTSRGRGRYDIVSRFFAPKVGVNEDPVTGSAHCKLAYYWGQKLNKSEFLAYQASPRGGEIHLSIHGDRVHLTGQAVTILEGKLLTTTG